MVECAGLEIRYTVIPYRGFESHSLRQMPNKNAPSGAFFFSTHQFTRQSITVEQAVAPIAGRPCVEDHAPLRLSLDLHPSVPPPISIWVPPALLCTMFCANAQQVSKAGKGSRWFSDECGLIGAVAR